MGVIETMVTGSEDGKVVEVEMVVEGTVGDAAMDITVDRDDVTGTVEEMIDVDETGGAVEAMQEVEQDVEQTGGFEVDARLIGRVVVRNGCRGVKTGVRSEGWLLEVEMVEVGVWSVGVDNAFNKSSEVVVGRGLT